MYHIIVGMHTCTRFWWETTNILDFFFYQKRQHVRTVKIGSRLFLMIEIETYKLHR